MEERERIRRTPSERSSEQETDETVEESTSAVAGDRIKAELDGLLDEIDEVLETNAEEFVRSFVQKGGQ
ncbi:MAG: ubiquitin-like protein Pup [Acidimicrobiia bacterium]